MVTVVGCCNGGDEVLAPLFIFKGKDVKCVEHGCELSEIAMKYNLEWTFNETAWMNSTLLCDYMKRVLGGWRDTHYPGKRLLFFLDTAGGMHSTDDVRAAADEANIQVVYGPCNLTGRWQPFDAGYGKELRNFVVGEPGLASWLRRGRNRRRWEAKAKSRLSISVHKRRCMLLKWAGIGWRELHTPRFAALRRHAWLRTGCLIRGDGENDAAIKPQGLPDYAVIPP